jgi:biopolymer transport protein ExbD
MKSLHTPAVILLFAASLATGCVASKPANFREVVKGTVSDKDLHEAAMKSDRTITVTVDAGRNVFFRKEKVGTVEDIGPLKERVRQTIENNRRADLDATGGKTPDTEAAAHDDVVFFCAPADFKYGDVAGVIDAIKDAGGNPIGLTDCNPQP